MKTILCFACLFCLVLPAPAQDAYTFMWWADGYRGHDAAGRRIINVQTNRYGASFDVGTASSLRLGEIEKPLPYAEAAAQSNDAINALPQPKLTMSISVGGTTYTCVRAAVNTKDEAVYPVRLIEGGRWLHRFDILALEFESGDGKKLDAEARLEVAAWPDRMQLTLALPPSDELSRADVSMTLDAGASALVGARGADGCVRLTWPPAASEVRRAEVIMVSDPQAAGAAVSVAWDPLLAAYKALLPSRQWGMAEDLDHLDQFPLSLKNDGDAPMSFPLVFAFEGAFQGVTGLCPMLRDEDGNPTGIPVQISKNWHRRPERRLLYEGPWFHAATEITVPAHATWEGEFAVTYARWGGVPGAAHAQLSLVGWGGNQRWDQASIGSFGESICYDPDVGLNRSMIDDVRPLMVRSMNDGKWEWTHNVGGGDFLAYFNAAGAKQYWSRVKCAYLSQGPNLTDVVYAGASADGKIEARIEVSTPRCNDVNHAYHRIRCYVREPCDFSRLAFYQLGADGYNDHQFTRIARGNAEGVTEEWETERGGKKYLREAMVGEGRAPWIALLGGIRSKGLDKGAWADRAMVVRAWKARLGGKDIAAPSFAVYGTENGIPSANAELVPPAGVTHLEPGDFVDAEIELLILPQNASDYYGPNAALRTDLEANGGTWRVAQRLARGNDLKIEMSDGTLTRSLPIEVAVDPHERATFQLTGGMGYIPMSFTGLKQPTGHTIQVDGTVINQSTHGNDFWQATYDDATKSYSITYNVPLDGEATIHKVIFTSNE